MNEIKELLQIISDLRQENAKLKKDRAIMKNALADIMDMGLFSWSVDYNPRYRAKNALKSIS